MSAPLKRYTLWSSSPTANSSRCTSDEQPKPGILGPVDVLVFVGEHALEPVGPARAIVPVKHHGPHWPKQQISEIGSVGVAQNALILSVDPGRCAQAWGSTA